MDSATDQTEAGQLPLRKRKQSDEGSSPVATAELTPEPETKQQKALSVEDGTQPLRRGTITKAREIRLEQNRKAARESRRRKKVMIEELQRSVIFFSRANGTLKQQNEELSRLLIQAQAQVAALEGHHQGASTQPPQQQPLAQVKQEVSQRPPQQSGHFQQAEANAVAAQAVYESQGFPAAAARAVAQTMNGATTAGSGNSSNNAQSAPTGAHPPPRSVASLPPMQPGATMQAMANFQQAAAAAMQAAVQGMQSIPGVSVQALTATAPAGANPQQAYNDTMTALAMQQAAVAAAAGQQYFQHNPYMAHSLISWNGQTSAPAESQPPPAPAPKPVAQSTAPTEPTSNTQI